MSGVFVLGAHPDARKRALMAVQQADDGMVVTIKPKTRSSESNARLHALLTSVSEQKEWAGRKWDIEAWKRLMVAAWMRTRNEHMQMVPSLDGHGFDVLFHRTSKMTGAEVSELMTFVEAWGAEHGVDFGQM